LLLLLLLVVVLVVVVVVVLNLLFSRGGICGGQCGRLTGSSPTLFLPSLSFTNDSYLHHILHLPPNI
jgi:hypothetical protein